MNTYLSYKFEGASGVGAGLAVVAGTNPGGCNLPGGANAKGFLGITSDSLLAAEQNMPVSVVRMGCRIAAVASGAITHGHWVNIANASGQVQDCEAAVNAAPGTAAQVNVIGKAETDAVNAGDQVYITIEEFVVQIAAS